VLVLCGVVVGVLSGLIGIGGGIVLVPVMVLGFRVPQHLAQGTSLAALVPSALVGTAVHRRLGNLDGRSALWMGGAGILGALAGALLAAQLPNQLLARGFGLFLIFAAYRTWVSRPSGAAPTMIGDA
jgi:uncharacterized membrane protein YfcA